MNRFTILNLSDLHLDTSHYVIQEDLLMKLAVALNSFFNISANFRWRPDFIVLPGDIINKGKTDNYKFAGKILAEFCRIINLPQSHVIMVPGNHDKLSIESTTISEYNALISKFEDFSLVSSSSVQSDLRLSTFLALHEPRFMDFNSFHRDFSFVDVVDYQYFSFDLFRETMLEFVTGMKVFKEHRVCFLNLNTEWLYEKDELINESPTDIAPAKRKFRIGKNIVRDLHFRVMKDYPDYTIITLMHHHPYDLDWSELNSISQTGMFTFNFIENCSDIIFSGHNHAVRTDVPDLIKNRVQHFSLGTPSWIQQNKNGDFHNSTSLVCIDDISDSVELLTCSYNQLTPHQIPDWKFNEQSIQSYPLRSKYEKRNWEKPFSLKRFGNVINLRVRNFKESTVVERILNYFNYKEDELYLKHFIRKIDVGKLLTSNNDEKSRLDQIANEVIQLLKKEDNKLIHLMFYYEINSSDRPEDFVLMDFISNSKDSEHLKQLNLYKLAGKLVISFISVEIPCKFFGYQID